MPSLFVAFYDLCCIKFKSYHFSQDGNPFSLKLFIARFYQEDSISFYINHEMTNLLVLNVIVLNLKYM